MKDTTADQKTFLPSGYSRIALRFPDPFRFLARMLHSEFLRHGVQTVPEAEAEYILNIRTDVMLPPETFTIEKTAEGLEISGHGLSELAAGAGSFLHESRYRNGKLFPADRTGTISLQKPFRCIYFATHFYNFYHVAPLNEIRDYIANLALWGFNTLALWYDLHHFHDIDCTESITFRKRLLTIAGYAREAGMKIFCLTVSNEAFANSPESLRARKENGQRGGWYDSQICPSCPGGLDYLKKQFDEVCRKFIVPLNPEYISFWPYDQGGCGCEECHPWGGNGFLKTYEALRSIANRYIPQTKWNLSFWFCQEDEWNLALEKITENPHYCDYIMEENPVFKRKQQIVPQIGFPEISMNHLPWGGYGAAPQPERFQKEWNARKDIVCGGYVYSEGIFEDLNKVIFSQFYCFDRLAKDTVKIYAEYEFGETAAENVCRLIDSLEKNHELPKNPYPYKDKTAEEMDSLLQTALPLQNFPDAETACSLAEHIHSHLPEEIRNSWRWRILNIRAKLDRDFRQHGGLPSPECDSLFAELMEIYHAENALDYYLKPVVSNRFRKTTESAKANMHSEERNN